MSDIRDHDYIEPSSDGSWRCSCGSFGGGREVSESGNVTYSDGYAAWMLHRAEYA